MLSNLPAIYDTFQTMWKTVNPTQQTLINLQTWLLDEERSIHKRQAENAHSHTSAYYSKSFRPSGQSRGYRNPQASGSPPRPFLTRDQRESRLHRAQEIAAKKQVSRCGNCGAFGHWHKECPHSPRWHVPGRNRGMPVSSTHPNLPIPASSSLSSSWCGERGSSSPSSLRHSPMTMSTPRAFMVQFLDCEIQPTDWFADNGSSHHMSNQRSWFTNFTTVPVGTWPVEAVVGHTTFVEGFGDIGIEIFIHYQWERGVLTDILFVPTLQRNLFSVSSATLKNINTLYTNTGCQMLADGIVLMEGSLEGMLYRLHIKAIASSPHANLILSLGTGSIADGTRSLEIWHKWLCHLNYPTILANMDRSDAVTGMILQNRHIPTFCEGCVLGKSHRYSFLSQSPRISSQIPGYLIHADICGPMAQASLGGAFYYLLFKDDHSGF